jgi:hypothetical protein
MVTNVQGYNQSEAESNNAVVPAESTSPETLPSREQSKRYSDEDD